MRLDVAVMSSVDGRGERVRVETGVTGWVLLQGQEVWQEGGYQRPVAPFGPHEPVAP